MSELIPDGQYFYDIPYGAMLPVRLDNVLAAGRNLSSDIYGQSGCRLIMLCMTLGEAAGTASAMSLDAGVTPRALDVASLQRQLAQNDVNIGQGFREIPALRDVKADFSHHKVTYINRNG